MRNISLLFILFASLLPAESAACRDVIRVKGFEARLSGKGEIVAATVRGLKKNVAARTVIEGGVPTDTVKAARLPSGGVQFTRTLRRAATDGTLTLIDRFTPAGDSLRWEIEVASAGEPWTAEIATEVDYPATAATRFWTAWSDPEHRPSTDHQPRPWHDPLVCRPLSHCVWTLGAYRTQGLYVPLPLATLVKPTDGDYTPLPLATLVEPADDAGLSIVFSPEDVILPGSRLSTEPSGRVRFARANYRLGGGKPVRFAVDLTAHEADWRGGLRWMVNRYRPFFDPPCRAADEMAGCGAYSGDENPIDVAKLRQMAFRINWKLSDDFPYMGMFIPPVQDADEKWDRSCDEKAPPNKPRWTTCRRLNDYARYMKSNGFYVLNYFNVTEFGKNMDGPPAQQARRSRIVEGPARVHGHAIARRGPPQRQRHLLRRERGRFGRSGVSGVHPPAGRPI